MKSRPLIFILVAAMLFSAETLRAEPKKFEGRGSAVVEPYNMAQTRSLAMKSASRAALENAVGYLINPKVFKSSYFALSSEIFSRASKFVTETLSMREERKGENYEIVVLATIDMPALRAQLIKMGLLLPPEKMPKWMIVAPEIVNGAEFKSSWIAKTSGSTLMESGMSDFVKSYGYRVSDPSKETGPAAELLSNTAGNINDILAAAKQSGANYLIAGSGAINVGGGLSSPDYFLGSGRIEIKIYEVESGKIIGEVQKRIGFEVTEKEGLETIVAHNLCGEIQDELNARLNAVNPSGAAGYNEIKFRFSGFTNYSEYSNLIASIEEGIKGVKSIKLISLAQGTAVVSIYYAGDKKELIKLLGEKQYTGLSIEPAGENEGILNYKVIPRPS